MAKSMGFPIHRGSWGTFLSKLWRMFPPFSTRWKRIFICLGVVCLMVVVVMTLFYDRPIDPQPQPSLQRADNNSVVTVLLWSLPFGDNNTISDCLAQYQIEGCRVTDVRHVYAEADAVIIHHREIVRDTPLPQKPRPAGQKWIWMNYESPTNTPDLVHFEGIFNLSLTYRRDSDIFLPYGFVLPSSVGNASHSSDPYLRTPSPSNVLRPRLLAWVISNWNISHTRVAFYKQLQRYLHVDVYGRFGQPFVGSVVELLQKYQFYLALENSQHTDYITEKLWNSIKAGAIPVVLGPSRQNYERFLPAEAFIHVDDFPTVRELAYHLLMLRRKPEQLMSHLRWRENQRIHQPKFWSEHYCTACKAVRRTRGQTNVVKDLAGWFYS